MVNVYGTYTCKYFIENLSRNISYYKIVNRKLLNSCTYSFDLLRQVQHCRATKIMCVHKQTKSLKMYTLLKGLFHVTRPNILHAIEK